MIEVPGVDLGCIGPSGTNRPPPSPVTRRVLYSSDEDEEPERPVWPPHSPRVESEDESESSPPLVYT